MSHIWYLVGKKLYFFEHSIWAKTHISNDCNLSEIIHQGLYFVKLGFEKYKVEVWRKLHIKCIIVTSQYFLILFGDIVDDVTFQHENILCTKKNMRRKPVNKPYPQNHIVILRATKPYKQKKVILSGVNNVIVKHWLWLFSNGKVILHN